MTDLISLSKNDISTTTIEISLPQPESTILRNTVRESLRQYFVQLENTPPANLYELVLEEIEVPLLEAVLKHVKQNQSKAARLLAMSRGTLRKKIQYGLLPRKRKNK